MAVPLQYPLSIYRGDSARWRFVLWADAAKTTPVDLAGVLVAAELRQDRRIIPLQCTVSDGNMIDVFLSAAVSQQLTVTSTHWDLQLTYSTGDVQTIVAGSVHVAADVTGSSTALLGVPARV